MPHKGFKHSEESKSKMSLSAKGKKKRPRTKEHCENISKALKRIGYKGGLLGKHHSDESKRKIRDGNVGKKRSPEAIENNRRARIGKKPTPETRQRLSESRRGEKHWRWKGGRSKLHLGWNESVRKPIVVRDNGECCIKDETCLGKLDVHHILPYKFCVLHNIENPHSERNLISLCQSHHMRLEYNPTLAIPLFLKTLSDRYNYQYDLDYYYSLIPLVQYYIRNEHL